MEASGPQAQPSHFRLLQGPGGLGAGATGQVVGCFYQEQLSHWAACSPDPWIVATLTWGYELHFQHQPPAFGRVNMTVIKDSAKAQALAQELSTLLDKGAITPVDPLLQPWGFYSTYFLVGKKDGGLCPILDLCGLNRYLKVLPFHMLTSADVMHVIQQGEWFTSIDLKDAYFLAPIVAQSVWSLMRARVQILETDHLLTPEDTASQSSCRGHG